jgi:putative lipoic acid-binding regulatory protein
MNGDNPSASGLEFPCEYPIKAMGRAHEDFQQLIVSIVETHVTTVEAHQVRSRSSSAGKFESITVTVRVESRTQLEAIFQDLADCEQVLWTL